MTIDRVEPSEEALQAAKQQPNGWVYQIDRQQQAGIPIPPDAIAGAWKVDAAGNIVGDFIPNPNYKHAEN